MAQVCWPVGWLEFLRACCLGVGLLGGDAWWFAVLLSQRARSVAEHLGFVLGAGSHDMGNPSFSFHFFLQPLACQRRRSLSFDCDEVLRFAWFSRILIRRNDSAVLASLHWDCYVSKVVELWGSQIDSILTEMRITLPSSQICDFQFSKCWLREMQ